MSEPTHVINLPRYPLALLPTPVHELKRLSAFLGGPRLLVKRDDQTGLATGGNKTRKLEFLLADALQKKADVLVTAGAVQSNHCRQTAAAANLAGLACDLVVNGEMPEQVNGNFLLDLFLGSRVHLTTRPNRTRCLQRVAEELVAKGQHPYVIPVGGSTGLGALGYALAMQELLEQLRTSDYRIDYIVFASSSGGTQAGLQLGARLFNYPGQVLGISIDNDKLDGAPFQQELARITNEAGGLIGLGSSFSAADFSVQYDYLGEGYGILGDLEAEAIGLAARYEGLLLDPVYTGRAFGAMVDLIRKKILTRDETVLFWHTGGTAALFAYAGELHERINSRSQVDNPCR